MTSPTICPIGHTDGMPKPTAAILPLTAARRRRPTASPQVVAAIATAADRLEQQLGGRTALITALSVTLQSDEISSVVAILGDPANDTKSLAQICAEVGFAPAEIFQAYERAVLARARLLALQTAAAAAPAVADDLVRRAVPHNAICPECHGRGKITRDRRDPTTHALIPKIEDCLACAGVGTLRAEADRASQDRLLDLLGLLPKAGPGIAISNINAVAAAAPSSTTGGSLEALQEAVSQVLSRPKLPAPTSPGPVVEAEVLPSHGRDPA